MNIDPRKLLHLRAIAMEGTFGKAAAKLGMSQPALSLSISSLEQALGASLLIRSKKGAELTLIGRSVARSAEALDVLIHNMLEDIRLRKDGLEGKLSIGVSPIGTMIVVPEAVAMLRRSCPNIVVEIRELSDQALEDQLARGELDIAVHPVGSGAVGHGLTSQVLFSDRLVLICSRQNEMGRMRSASLGRFRSAAFVLPPPQSALAQTISKLFSVADVPFPVSPLMCTSMPMIKQIVSRSDYVAIVSDHLVDVDVKANLLKRIYLKESGSRQICARYRQDHGNAMVDRFLKALQDASKASRNTRHHYAP